MRQGGSRERIRANWESVIVSPPMAGGGKSRPAVSAVGRGVHCAKAQLTTQPRFGNNFVTRRRHETILYAMGRPPIRKNGAFTAAERQRRRRRRLRREAKAAERALIQEKNKERYARRAKEPAEWTRAYMVPKDEPSIFREAGIRRADLDDEDVLAMLEQITEMARERGLI
jgi:hypothetical protein